MTAAPATDRRPDAPGTSRGRPPSRPARRPGTQPPAEQTDQPDPGTPASGGLAERAQQLLVTAIDRLAHAAAEKVDELAGKLDGIAEHGLDGQGGVGMNALLQGGLAKLQGKNPVWAAIKGAVSAMSTTTKVVVGLLLVLTAVLAPVALLVLAIVLLVLAIVGAVSS